MNKARAVLNRATNARETINKNPSAYDVGLCRLLMKSEGDGDLVRGIIERWPERRGNSLCFPIAAPAGYVIPDAHREHYSEKELHLHAFDFLPKYTGEYGASRLRLLDFIIAELEKLT